jgi:5-methylcytosine-specific restriction endonuclease McrA
MVPSLKICSQCQVAKPLGWFSKNGGRLRSACKECERGRAPGSRRLSRVPKADIQRMLIRQNWVCACGCGRSIRYAYHLDHVKPLARGGVHHPSNWQLLAPICNLRKGKKYHAV